MPKTLRVASLLRISTTMVEQSESPEAQRLYILEQIRLHQGGIDHWADTGIVYQDELTGAVVMNRPDVKRLVEDAIAKRFDAILMKSIKRMGRDTLGLLTLKRFLDDHGIELIGLQDGYRSFRDLELIFLIHADRAQAEREDLARNVRNAMRQRAKQGRWTCGKVPFGFRRKNRHEIEPHPETAPLVQEIFRLRRSGWAVDRITRYLNESQFPAPAWWEARDRLSKLEELQTVDERYADKYKRCRRLVNARKGWHFKSVHNILANTAYYGQLQYYRRYWKRLSSQGGKKVLQTRDASEVILVPCPPLMTKEEWQTSQHKLKEVTRSTARYVYLLSGLICCRQCGAKMTGGGTGHNKGNRPYYGYYYCTSMRKGLCSCKSIRSLKLEQAVLQVVINSLSSVEHHEIRPVINHEAPKIRVRELEAKLEDLKGQRRYYRNEHRVNRVAEAELNEELLRIHKEEKLCRLALDTAKRELVLPTMIQHESDRLRYAATRLLEQLGTTPIGTWNGEYRRKVKSLLQLAVDRVVCQNKDDFEVFLKLSPASTGNIT